MKRVYLVCDEFNPILACSDLSDAYEMLLSFYEERTYDDFLWSCVYHDLSIEDYFDSMKCSFELYNKYNSSKKYETLGAYILDDEKHFSIVSMWEVKSMVAPSFQKFEFIGDVYVSAGKKYIQVKNPKTGTIRQVRWYEDAEYAKLYPEKAQEQGINQLPTHRQALGFRDAGFITIFKGGMNEDDAWFRRSNARYARWWGWYFRSLDAVPADLPADVVPNRPEWDTIGDANGNLLPEEQVQRVIDSLIYDESLAEWIGKVGERIEVNVTVAKAYDMDGQYGRATTFVMNDEKENVFMWTTATKNWAVGTVHHIRGTVKAQIVRKNVKINVLTRCNEVN